jgi:cell division protein FtsB
MTVAWWVWVIVGGVGLLSLAGLVGFLVAWNKLGNKVRWLIGLFLFLLLAVFIAALVLGVEWWWAVIGTIVVGSAAAMGAWWFIIARGEEKWEKKDWDLTDEELKKWKEESARARQILFTLLAVLLVAIIGEVLMHLFPLFLHGVKERQWLEWLLVALIGDCAYLIWAIGFWYQRPKEAEFRKYTPWYLTTVAKGPIVALVILLTLTNINFQAQLPAPQSSPAAETEVETPPEEETDLFDVEEAEEVTEETETTAGQNPLSVGVDFSQAKEEVLLIAAFLLGFYNRLARDILDSIARAIFPKAWKEAHGKEDEARES